MAYQNVAKLQQGFGYPDIVAEHLTEILATVESHISALMLTGSTARGELTCMAIEGSIRVMGDYEFLLVPLAPAAENSARIRASLAHLEEAWMKDHPLCHIDVTILARRQLSRLPATLQTYENRINGIPLVGEDIRPAMRPVSLSNLDFKELNEILLWRLMALMLYAPKALVEGVSLNQIEDLTYRYLIYRNVLDLSTWMLPRQGILLPSFTQRVEFLQERSHALPWLKHYPTNFVAFLREAMEVKRGQIPVRPLADLHRQALEFFSIGLETLLDEAGVPPTGDLTHRLTKGSSRCFRDWAWRRKARESILALQGYPAGRKPWQRLAWIMRAKYGPLVAAMLELHRALAAMLAGQPAGSHLIATEELITRMTGKSIAAGTSAADVWLWQRKELLDFLLHYFRWIGAKKVYYLALVESSRAS